MNKQAVQTRTIKARHVTIAIEGMLRFAAEHGARDIAERGIDAGPSTAFIYTMMRRFGVEYYSQIPRAVCDLHETLHRVACAVADDFTTTDDEGHPIMADMAVVEAAVRAAAMRAVNESAV